MFWFPPAWLWALFLTSSPGFLAHHLWYCFLALCKRQGFDPCIGKIPWRRKWQPTPVFLPGEYHGQRSLVGCSPWGRKELDRTETT